MTASSARTAVSYDHNACVPSPSPRRFDVYGRFVIEVARAGNRWTVCYVGDGLKRPAHDIQLPPEADEQSLADHLDILLHEYGAPGQSIRQISS
jgi:hypothetical protein